MAGQDNTLRRSTLLSIIIFWNLLYFLAVFFGSSRIAIEIFNVILFSVATGVAASYLGDMCRAFKKPVMEGPDILAVGIFVGWFSVMIARGGSIIWRLADKPVDWLDNALWGGHIVGSTIAATCHLLAPKAVAGRIPTQQWIRIGLWSAATAFFGALFFILSDILD